MVLVRLEEHNLIFFLNISLVFGFHIFFCESVCARNAYIKLSSQCIAQFKKRYIKADRTKHILPKFFFTHELQNNDDVSVLQIRSGDTFKKLVRLLRLRRLKDLHGCTHEGSKCALHFFFFNHDFFYWVFLISF